MLATKTNRDEGGDVLIMPWRPSVTACLPSIPATRATIGNEDKITIYNHTLGPGILSDHLFNIKEFKDIKYSSLNDKVGSRTKPKKPSQLELGPKKAQ